jgi:hypothetical protein
MINAMISALAKMGREPMEKWGLPADGRLRYRYTQYKHWDKWHTEEHYDHLYWDFYFPPPPPRVPRYGSAYEMFINGPFGEE